MNTVNNFLENYGSIITWVPTIIFGLCVLIQLLFGLLRGLRKNSILMSLSIIALVIAYVLYACVLTRSFFEEFVLGLYKGISGKSLQETLNVSEEGTVTAADIDCPADVEIINKDQVICTIVKGGKLNMELTVSNGRGYVRAENNKKLLKKPKIGTIAIDSIYSPIERVNYEVEEARVGQSTNYDKLIMEIWTNGSMKAEEAIALASRIIIEHLNILTDLNEIADITGIMAEKEEDPKVKALETSIDDMEFSVRAYNCLKRSGINTMQDLVNRKESDMMKIRNLGKKSLKEVLDKVKAMGLSFKNDD